MKIKYTNPWFWCIVAHEWTGSYLLKNYGAHFRKSLRIISKKVLKNGSDWVGDAIWGSPKVSTAPPST